MDTPWEKPANALDLIAYRARMARAVVENVPSPCISVCRMHPQTGWCEGCYRTMDEIRLWSRADDATKKQVWARIEERLAPELA